MNRLSLRFVQRAGARCNHRPMPYPLYTNSSSCLVNRWNIAAAYSSSSRQSSEGKSVIVTGSSRGIGKAIALRLAADGYSVCVNDLSANKAQCDEVVEQIRSTGRKACTAVADVTKRDEVKDMIQTSVRELGPLNTMIANAGVVQVDNLLEVSEKDFQFMFDVNVFGVQNCLAEAAKQMISQGNCRPDSPGKLLAASSIVGFKSFPLMASYSSSKASVLRVSFASPSRFCFRSWAVRGLTQAYAGLLAKHHITANSYAPGIVGTAMWDLLDEGISEVVGWEKGTVTGRFAEQLTALGRISVPEDVAKMVSFLASSDSDFVTGQTQLVDGGTILT
ncbi:hypothetical protein F5Y10DRAFT_260734 [Nemania abortiva]|nr:hypothetical protein F5Y10DRAFT_260734 [Nemania abortiva]